LTARSSVRTPFSRAACGSPLELIDRDGQMTLRAQDPRGQLLLVTLLGKPWAVGPVLRVAAGIAGALSGLHGQGLVHRDVKPANVLVDTTTSTTWLTGFGLTTRLARERPSSPPAIEDRRLSAEKVNRAAVTN